MSLTEVGTPHPPLPSANATATCPTAPLRRHVLPPPVQEQAATMHHRLLRACKLFLLYFWRSPCVPSIPLFLHARIGCGASAKWFIAPVCAKPPSTLEHIARSALEIRSDFVSGSTWLDGFLDIVVVKVVRVVISYPCQVGLIVRVGTFRHPCRVKSYRLAVCYG
jgi:hypothetical protein